MHWVACRLLQLDHHKSSEQTIASHQQEFLDDWRSKSTLFQDNSESNQMHIFNSRCIHRGIFLSSSLLSHALGTLRREWPWDKGFVISSTLHTALSTGKRLEWFCWSLKLVRQCLLKALLGHRVTPRKWSFSLGLAVPHEPPAQVRLSQSSACWLHCLQQLSVAMRASSSPGTQLIHLLPHQHELVITSPTGLSQCWVDFLLQRKFQASY